MPAPDNIERRKKTPDLDLLLGTYHWVWHGHPSSDFQITPPSPSTTGEEWGALALALKPRTRVAKPANIVGAFQLLQQRADGTKRPLRGLFTGLTPRRGKSGAGTWNIKDVVWDSPTAEGVVEEVGEMPTEGHRLWVSEVVDDNGHPFVGMYITEGPEGDEEGEGEGGGGGGEAWEVVGKRQGEEYVAGKGMEWEGLTEGEIERLGLLLGDEDADAEVDLDEREAGGVVVGGVVVEDADAEVDLDEREAGGVVVEGVAVEETPLIQPEEVPPDASEVPTTGSAEPPAVALEEPLETIVAPVDPLDAPPAIFAPPIETIAPATPIDPREDAIIEEEAVEISAAEPKSLPERGIVEEPPDIELPIRTADRKKAGEEEDKERRERSVTEEEDQAPVEVPAVEALKTAGAAEEEVIVEEAEEPMLGVTDLITERAVLEALNDDDTEKTIPNKRKAADAQIVPEEEEPEPKKLRVD